MQGEGVMGLPYALYVSGNTNSLLSLWPVIDKGTSPFMESFFKKVRAGKPQFAALNDTKREFLMKRARHTRSHSIGHLSFFMECKCLLAVVI